jgi:thiamine-monophosphate kinase
LRKGIGDDCAVIKTSGSHDLVITADLLIEDIDFRLGWTTPEFIGHKALAVSLSDVSAMGANPVWALVSIGVPEKIWQGDFVEKFYKGWFRLARKFKIELAGGDISRTTDKIVVDSIVAGEVKKNRAILRSGAGIGDLIFVTGGLGGAAAGLKLLEKGLRYETATKSEKELLLKQLQPTRDFKNTFLGENKLATAMIDLSDGLSSDLGHLCESSGVGAKIFADRIPIHPKLLKISEFKTNALDLALNGGEDFELLFTIAPKNIKKLEKHFGKTVTCIGEITDKSAGLQLVNGDSIIKLKPKGFSHF